MSKPNQLTQGDQVRLIDHEYPGLFKVINPLNLIFDDDTQVVQLVTTIEPLDVDPFKAHFCRDGLPDNISGFGIAIKSELLELVTQP